MNDGDSLSLAPDLATDATVPRLVQGSAAEAPATAPPRPESRRSFGPLSRRLADQGLFLFRHRGMFAVFLLPAGVLAVLERRSAALPADPGLGWLAVCLTVSLVGMAVRTPPLDRRHPAPPRAA